MTCGRDYVRGDTRRADLLRRACTPILPVIITSMGKQGPALYRLDRVLEEFVDSNFSSRKLRQFSVELASGLSTDVGVCYDFWPRVVTWQIYWHVAVGLHFLGRRSLGYSEYHSVLAISARILLVARAFDAGLAWV